MKKTYLLDFVKALASMEQAGAGYFAHCETLKALYRFKLEAIGSLECAYRAGEVSAETYKGYYDHVINRFCELSTDVVLSQPLS